MRSAAWRDYSDRLGGGMESGNPEPRSRRMGARLILLIVFGAGLAVYYGTRKPVALDSHVKVQEIAGKEPNLMLWNYDLPGEQPAEPPDLELSLSVDPSDGNRRQL